MNNQFYRYCFFCDTWKSKSEISEIDWGNGNKTFNCNVCRKDLGENIQIFYCSNHQDIILKVWGVLEGENREKIFYRECPKEKQQEKQPDKSPIVIDKWVLGWIGGAVVLICALAWIINQFFFKK